LADDVAAHFYFVAPGGEFFGDEGGGEEFEPGGLGAAVEGAAPFDGGGEIGGDGVGHGVGTSFRVWCAARGGRVFIVVYLPAGGEKKLPGDKKKGSPSWSGALCVLFWCPEASPATTDNGDVMVVSTVRGTGQRSIRLVQHGL
jgi:hypothetical protein